MTSKTDESASYEHAVAVVFDRLSETYNREYVDHACAIAGVHAGEQALDVGTGTGIMARALGSRLGGSGKVLGVDLAEGMLQFAEERGRKLGLTPHIVRFAQSDAERLEVGDSSVDLVTSLFVLRHLPDPGKAIAEMARVLRPGGRVVLAVGSAAPWRSLRGARYRAQRLAATVAAVSGRAALAPQHLLRLIDGSLRGERRLEGTEGHNALSSDPAGTLLALVREAGFVNVSTSWRGSVDRIATCDEFWDLQMHFSSAARYRVLGARPEARERLRSAFTEDCQRLQRLGGQLLYPHGAAFVVGRLPSHPASRA